MTDILFMRRAIELADERMRAGEGGPFGAVVVKNGAIVGEGWNRVVATKDPTAHAEIVAIRDACARLGTFDLEGATVYTSCEPCPMCMGAILWSRASRMCYAANRDDAAAIGFDDDFIYQQIPLAPDQRTVAMKPLLRDESLVSFQEWAGKSDKVSY